MDNICIDCRKSADCKRKPRTDQWTVAGCSWFEADTVITNADRIRQMTDEELADRIMGYIRCEACEREFHIECNPLMTCRGIWLEWLKAPAEEGKT